MSWLWKNNLRWVFKLVLGVVYVCVVDVMEVIKLFLMLNGVKNVCKFRVRRNGTGSMYSIIFFWLNVGWKLSMNILLVFLVNMILFGVWLLMCRSVDKKFDIVSCCESWRLNVYKCELFGSVLYMYCEKIFFVMCFCVIFIRVFRWSFSIFLVFVIFFRIVGLSVVLKSVIGKFVSRS